MAKKTIENNAEEVKTTAVRRKRSTTVKKGDKVEVRSDDVLTSQENQVKGVLANIEMLYNTIRDLKRMGKTQKIAHLNVAQEENFARLAAIDPSLVEETIKKYRTDDNGNLSVKKSDSQRVIYDETDRMIELINAANEVEELEADLNIIDKGKETIETVKVEEFEDNDIPTDEMYDVLPLPSNGECYPNKKSKIAVSYLTATDENFITSPNLYRDGLIIDCLLKRKVLDKSFDVDSLVSGDADAIIYFLRVSSYGSDFPARFTDPTTEQSFDTVIDLNQVKVKDFKLKGDENGWFDFTLPISKDVVKFRFLTKKDERKLEKLSQMDNKDNKAMRLREIVKYLDAALEDTSGLDEDALERIEDGMESMEKWAVTLDEKNGLSVNRLITNRLEMNVMSVNGNTDKKFIKKYVRNMPAKDSLSLRRYINENEPGLDFNIKIEKPESLGGGFINTFLEWDDAVFLSIA